MTDTTLTAVYESPGSPDTTAPRISLGGDKNQESLKVVKVEVSCDEAATVNGTGTIRVPLVHGGKSSRATSRTKGSNLNGQTKNLVAGEPTTLKLKLGAAAQLFAEKARRRGRKVKAEVMVSAVDAAGNHVVAKRTVKLVGQPKEEAGSRAFLSWVPPGLRW
jgi:hypothetical protein